MAESFFCVHFSSEVASLAPAVNGPVCLTVASTRATTCVFVHHSCSKNDKNKDFDLVHYAVRCAVSHSSGFFVFASYTGQEVSVVHTTNGRKKKIYIYI